ncbi:nSTAND1 domain-containing NTPase [Crocosphaera watsonii]
MDSEKPVDDNLVCPYRGLFHFAPNDSEFFFGRDIFIEELYQATKTRNFIPVLGASGSGKSSVVFAGLIPRLQKQGNWLFTHFRPGSDPFHALSLALIPLYATNLNETEIIIQSDQLAESLSQRKTSLTRIFTQIQNKHPNKRLLLFADQFEELYTLCPDSKTQKSFLEILISNFSKDESLGLSAISNLSPVLVTTMRADFLGNALSYPDFADLLRKNDTKIKSMNRQELTEVIDKPAHKLGVKFESGLVERILNDIESQPGNLPLLEFALTELWNQGNSKQLTHQTYEEIGQVEGALARHADEKYKSITEVEKEKIRRIFIQLVRPGEGTEDTRRIAVKTELGKDNWSLVKKLADARLVVTSRNITEQETVEVVHEALIKNWGKLQEWMKTARIFRAWQDRLRATKELWEATNKDTDCLLRGAALVEAEERLKERPEDLISEQTFIEESIKEKTRVEQEEKQRQQRELEAAQKLAEIQTEAVTKQKKANKKLRLGTLGLSIISLIAFITAGWAWNQTRIAELNLVDSMGRNAL